MIDEQDYTIRSMGNKKAAAKKRKREQQNANRATSSKSEEKASPARIASPMTIVSHHRRGREIPIRMLRIRWCPFDRQRNDWAFD